MSFSTAAAQALIEVYDESKDAATSLAALSCRTMENPGNVLIAGIVFDAPGNALVRHGGPFLAQLGFTGYASDPTLKVFNGANLIAQNDDWDSALQTTFQSVGAFGWTVGSKDAAYLIPVQGGVYTVHCEVKNTAGLGLIEVYRVH